MSSIINVKLIVSRLLCNKSHIIGHFIYPKVRTKLLNLVALCISLSCQELVASLSSLLLTCKKKEVIHRMRSVFALLKSLLRFKIISIRCLHAIYLDI